MRDGPEVERHLSCYQRVGVVKQVDVAPSQRTVLLREHTGKSMRGTNNDESNKAAANLFGSHDAAFVHVSRVYRVRAESRQNKAGQLFTQKVTPCA